MIRKTKPASLLLLLHLMAAPPPRHEHKNDLYSRGLKVIIMVFKKIEDDRGGHFNGRGEREILRNTSLKFPLQ